MYYKNSLKIVFLTGLILASFLAFSQASACIYGVSSHLECYNNDVYWFDCNNQPQYISQDCSYNQVCQSGQCVNSSWNNSCNYHAYKLCLGNTVYWFDSCDNRQDIYYDCGAIGMACKYGQCVSPELPKPVYAKHFKTACHKGNLYWYDSYNSINDVYKNCSDTNSCTQDGCSAGKCSNVLKCDGSTCAQNSEDFNKYCSQGNEHCGNGLCEPALGETSQNCPNDCKTAPSANLSVSFMGKKDASATQWDKTIQLGPDSNAYFLVTVTNSSSAQVDNVNVSANIPNEIGYLGNVKVDDASVSGDIVAGINIGSIAPGATKTVTFEGKTQKFTGELSKEATVTVSVSGNNQTDSFSIKLNPSQTGAVSKAPSGSWIVQFLKRWYLWILVAIVLIFLFVVVFRRLSKNY